MLVDFRLRDEVSGLVLIRKLRELQSDLPAVLITGDTAPERLQEASNAGVRMLHKPVDVDLLMDAIRAECGRNSMSAGW